MMAASEVKQEVPDEEEEDFEQMIQTHEVVFVPLLLFHLLLQVKEERKGSSNMVDTVMESVIQKGLRASERLPKVGIFRSCDMNLSPSHYL